MEPAPYTTAVLFFRISSISIIPFSGLPAHQAASTRLLAAYAFLQDQ
jgi:hypothetical protein